MISLETQKTLRNSHTFSQLDNDSIEVLLKALKEEKYAKRDVVIDDGECKTKLFFIVDGIAKAYKISPDGKEQIIMLLRNGDFFNETTLVDDQPMSYCVEAISPVTVVSISRDAMKELLSHNRVLSIWIAKMIVERSRYLVTLVEDLSFKSVMARVAKILVKQLDLEDSQRKLITQRDMAAMAGTAREVVSRALKSLEDDGYISIERNHIHIINLNAIIDLINE